MMLGANEKVGFYSEVDLTCDWSRPNDDAKLIKVQHKANLLMFLMSKDDNLLLLTGGLIFVILNSKDFIPEAVRNETPEFFATTD
jgi:hypothetical protein